MAESITGMPTRIVGPCSNEPPPPPIPPPEKKWNCVACSREDTPVRRSGPQGPGTLCNACGIRISKEKRKLAAAGAAAAAAAAGRPPAQRLPLRRSRQKRRPPLSTHFSKRKNHPNPASLKKQRCDILDNTKSNPVPSTPLVSIQRATSSPITSVAQSARPQSPAQHCPAQSAPSVPVQSTGPSMPTPSMVGVLNPSPTPTALTATEHSPPVSSPAYVQGLSPVQVTTPEDVRLMQPAVPSDPLAMLLRQSSQTEQSNPEEILIALDMGTTVNGGSSESMSRTDKDSFPGSVFAQCDDNGRTSTQIEPLNVFDGMTEEADTFLAGTSMVSVEGPYGEEGSMAAPAEFAEQDEAARCIDTLTRLDSMNAHIRQRMDNIDERMAVFSRRHEELTVQRNEVSISISHLMYEKDVMRKKQHLIFEDIARNTCLLQLLRKQEKPC